MFSIGNMFALNMDGCYSIGIKSRPDELDAGKAVSIFLDDYATYCLSSCNGSEQGKRIIPNYPENQKSLYESGLKNLIEDFDLVGITPLIPISSPAFNTLNPLYVLAGQLLQINKQHSLEYKKVLKSYVHTLSDTYPFGNHDEFMTHISVSEQNIDGRPSLLILAHKNQCMTCGINAMLGRNEWITLDLQSFILCLFWPIIESFVFRAHYKARTSSIYTRIKNVSLIKNIKKIYKKMKKNNFMLYKNLDLALTEDLLDLFTMISLRKFEVNLEDPFSFEEFKKKKNLFYSVISYSSILNYSSFTSGSSSIRSFLSFCSFSTGDSDPVIDRVLSFMDRIHMYNEGEQVFAYAQGGLSNALYNLLPNMGVSDVTSSVAETIDNVGEVVDKFNEVIDSLQNKGRSIDETMSYVLKDLGPKMIILVVVSVASYGLIKYYIDGDRSILIQMGVFVAASVVIMPDEIKKLLLSFLDIGKEEEIENLAVAQSAFSWEPIVKIITLAIGFISGVNLKDFTFKSKDIINALGSLPKIESGISYCMDAIPTIATSAINFVREYIFNMHPIMRDKTHIDEIDKFIVECTDVIEKHYDSKPPYKREDFNKIILMQQKCSRFYAKDYGNKTTTNDIRKVLTRYQALLEKVRKPYDNTSLRAEFARCEPLVVLLRGEPGQGKSVAGSLFAQAMCAKILGVRSEDILKNTTDYIYSRNAENIYWEGYGGQFCTFMDDFGQCKDIAGTPDNEYMNLIRLGNSFQSPLHMASLESKANTFFQSQLIVCTTNQYTFNSVQSINFKSALTRRFDVVVDIRVNDEKDSDGTYKYARESNGTLMLDSKKWCSKSVLVDLYRDMTYESKGDFVCTISFDEFLDHCISRFNHKQETYEHIIKNNADVLGSFEDSNLPTFDMIDLEDGEELLDEEVTPKTESYIEFDDIEYPNKKDLYSFFFNPCQVWFDQLSSICMRAPFLVDSFIRDLYYKLKNKFKDINLTIRNKIPLLKDYFFNSLKKLKTWFSETMVTVSCYISVIFEQFPIVRVATQITMWYALYRMVVWFISPNNNTNSGKNVKQGPNVKPQRFTRDKLTNKLAEAQNAADEHPIAKKIVDKNTLLIKKSGCNVVWARCTILRGSICMIPNHYFHIAKRHIEDGTWELGECVDFYSTKNVLIKESTIKEFLSMERYDLPKYDCSFFVLPGRLKTFPDITKHFMSYEDLPKKYLPSVLFVPMEDGTIDKMEFESTITESRQYYLTEHGDKLYTDRVASYFANTTYGDCGSLLFALDTRFYPKPIYGMHVAGCKSIFSDIGYSTVITSDIINQALKRFECVELCSPPIDDLPYNVESMSTTVFDDNFRFATKTSLPVGSANKTALVKVNSLYGSLGECTIAPAKLCSFIKDDKLIDPFGNRIKTYTKHSSYMPEDMLVAIAESYADYVISQSDELSFRILTFEEAVAGIPGEPYMNGIPRGTSSGYPECKLKPPGAKGKKHFFGSEGDYEFDSENCFHLKDKVESIIKDARDSKRQLHIYADFLKDETRPLNKVEKPRIVSCAPIAYTIAVRTRFLSIVSWLMRNRVKNGMSVGVNPYKEWTSVAKYLENDSIECMIAGDFSGFDTTINSAFWKPVHKFFMRILKHYNVQDIENESKIMAVLLLEVFNSVHVRGSSVYYWNAGMPSGNPLTTIVNCIVNQIIIRFTWIICHGRRLSSLHTFNENVKAIVYGDDNLISVSEASKKKYNPISVRDAFAEIGFTYTSETKDVEIDYFRTIYQVSFLKRSFVWWDETEDSGLMLAPLEFETIRQMLYYVRKNKDFKSVIHSSYESFLHELALHDEETWNKCYKVIAPLMEQHFDYVSDTVEHMERRNKTLQLNDVY